jgi:hypothetical protein
MTGMTTASLAVTLFLFYLLAFIVYGIMPSLVDLIGIPYIAKIGAFGSLGNAWVAAPLIMLSEFGKLFLIASLSGILLIFLSPGYGFRRGVIGGAFAAIGGSIGLCAVACLLVTLLLASNPVVGEVFKWVLTILSGAMAILIPIATYRMARRIFAGGADDDDDDDGGGCHHYAYFYIISRIMGSGLVRAIVAPFWISLGLLIALFTLEASFGSLVAFLSAVASIAWWLLLPIIMIFGLWLAIKSVFK